MTWFVGDDQLPDSIAEQANSTEDEDERRWKSISTLKHKFAKADYGKPVTCRVEHPAYATGFREATVVLDVLCE